MKLYNLVKTGVLPSTKIFQHLKIINFNSLNEIKAFFSNLPYINNVNLERMEQEYVDNQSKKNNLYFNEAIFVLTEQMTLETLLQNVIKYRIFKEYTLTEACFLIEFVTKAHSLKKGSEILILLKKDTAISYPALSMSVTDKGRFNIRFRKIYSDMHIALGNSLILHHSI